MKNLRTINATLLLVRKNNKILLGEKKRGFAKGTLNGFGGKQDPGETIEHAMIRETREEAGIIPIDYSLIGNIIFNTWYKGENVFMDLFIYSCSRYHGKVSETEEMIPFWFDEKQIPYEKMLADDRLWLPLVLENKKFYGQVMFDQDMNVNYQNFEEVDSLEEMVARTKE